VEDRSRFVPFECRAEWLSVDEVCQLLQKFSYIWLIGDSLTRHIFMAILIILSQNLEFGAYTHIYTNSWQVENCRCDGQFSENFGCRVDPNLALVYPNPYGEWRFCNSALTDVELRYFDRFEEFLPFNDRFCHVNQSKPSVVLVMGGFHFGLDANRFIDQFLEPHVKLLLGRCPHSSILWSNVGRGQRDAIADLHFPHQSDYFRWKFNNVTSEFVSRNRIDTFDVWNLTEAAPTSDGLHYLTEVNVLRAHPKLKWLLGARHCEV